MRPFPVLAFLAIVGAAFPAGASLPDGLYTTQAALKGAPTPVGFNAFTRSGFTLRIGSGWRLAQPILPLDMTWLKPWIENPGPGFVVRIQGVDGDTPAEAAAKLARARPGVVDSSVFFSDGGLKGVRVLWGTAEKRGGVTVWKAAYLFANRPGFVYAFVAEPWPRGSGRPLLSRTGPAHGAVLPSDALMTSAALERGRVGQRDN